MSNAVSPNKIFRGSLRWRIVLLISAVVLIALASVVLLTRSVLLSQVTENSNSAVEQEIDEFTRMAEQGTDPTTGEPFDSAERLITVFMSRQIPDDDEMLLGRIDDQLIQMDYTQIDSPYPEPVNATDPVVAEIFGSAAASGIYDDPERGRVHWGRIAVDAPVAADFAVAAFSQDDRRQAENTVRAVAGISLLGLGAAVLIAWIISGQVIAPIRQLRRVASQINNSDLTRRVPVHGTDEIAHLAETFNAMLDRLEDSYREQRQFVDDAGHELRTPITVVRGQLELLELSPPEERERSIELATQELDRMSRMVNDMLTLAVADSGELASPAPTDVADLAITIEDKAATISERIRLVQVAEGTVDLDGDRITEAVLELCGNALRYSDGAVEIGTEFIGDGAERAFRIWVRDRGMGVSEEQQQSLFGRFSRGEQSETSRPSGAGLGLSIVKAIAEAHGGKAYVESTVGLGSIFGIAVPAVTQEDQS